ncbi:MAG TPA: glycosyltransferase family 39 protein [Anaerolineae bacterium]|nr:glycosyltransferase family 39 protein [Anaerolineae bacterium]
MRIDQALNEHRGLALVLSAFLILGVLYGTVTPIFEAPDELQHYFHVKHIADGKGLPVLKPQGEALYGQEGGQPSLYYLLGAATTFWIDTSDAEELLEYNPYVNLGVPVRDGNKNVILHTARESFPYRGTTLAVHLLRYVSLLFGVVTIAATYFLAREVSRGTQAVALAAAVLTAFNPQFIFTSAAVNNDILLTALCSLAVLFSVLIVTRGPSTRRYVALGVAVSLASLTKLTGLGLMAVVLVLLIMVARRHSPREAVRGGLMVVGLVLLLASWWYLRNWLLYQDLTGMNRFLEALGTASDRNLTVAKFLDELEGFRLSYWAIFGWFNVLADGWVYRFYDVLVMLGVLGIPLALVRGLKKPRTVSTPALLLMLVWMAVVAAGYVRYNQLIDAATGRLVFPAICCVSAFLAWGMVQLPPRRHARGFVYAVGTVMLLVALVVPPLYISPVYARPPVLSSDGLESIPNQTDVTYGGQMRLLSYALESEVFRPGEAVYVTLYWQGLAQMDDDYSVSLILLTPSGDLIGQEDSYPGLGSYPTSEWKPGDVVADRCWVRIRPRTEVPTIGWVGVSVYHLPTMEHLPATQGGQAVEQAFLQPVKVVPWESREYDISQTLSANLGNQVDLVGYDLDKREVRAGGTVRLTLYWRPREEMEEDYTVFTHLVDAEAQIRAQDDDYPLGGDYPTSFWGMGEVIQDRYELNLPLEVRAGEYEIEVGFYLASSGSRLPVLDDAGQVLDNRVVLGTVMVTD